MKRILFALAFWLSLSGLAKAQGGNMLMISFPGVPTGSCAFIQFAYDQASGNVYQCSLGSWVILASGGGSGTVTQFSSGNLSPLFTTSVATATTTPALSFSLSNAAGLSWFGNDSGSSGAPSYNTSALPYTMGGTGLSTITASECLQGNSGGTAIVYGSCGGGGGGSPGGSPNQIQYQVNSSTFGGMTSTYNSTSGDVFLAGQSPFTDALSATVGMVCDGSTDDTTAFQTWLNTTNTSGYAQLFIPYTGHLCYIAGYESSFSSSSIGNCGSPSVTCLTFSPAAAVPTWVVVGAPIQLWGMGTSLTGCSAGTASSTIAGCNGLGYVQAVTTGSGGSITVWFGVSPGGTAPSSGSFSIGPWISGNTTIEGECTTNQSGNTDCSGLSTFKSGTSNAEVALTYAPCLTGNPMNMTCPTGNHNPGARVEHLNIHGDGTALGGLYTSTLNGGLIADNTVFGFTGSVGNGAFPAFAFALDGIQSNEQNVKFTNNKGFNVERGFLSIGSNSGNEFNLNHFICGNPTPIIASSVAYDLGWWWMTNTSASSTGGENTVSALQTENCEGGVWFDGQNEDRLFGKATEITSGGQASDTSSIVVSVQNSNSMQLFFDDKTGCTGYYQDAASTGILVFMTVSTSSIHSGCSSPNTGNGASFTNASNVLASGYDVATSEYHFDQAQSSGSTLAKGDYLPTLFLNTALSAANGGTGLSSITASECLQGNSGGTAIVYGSCGSGSGVTLETNGSNNSSQTTLNLTSSSATNGLTLTETNTSGGTVQLGLSGTLTNAGLANSAITIAGTSVSLGGSTSSLPSPGAIGGTTPAAITGTTLTANTSLTINGGTAQTGTQGTDTKLLTAGTVSGTGSTLCTDSNGGATTSGCSGGYSPTMFQSSTSTGNIGSTSLVSSTSGTPGLYTLKWEISLTTAGTSCTGSTTVVLNDIFTDPATSSSITNPIGTITIASNGVGTVGYVANGQETILTKNATSINYSTSSYTLGTGCTSTNPTYQVSGSIIYEGQP